MSILISAFGLVFLLGVTSAHTSDDHKDDNHGHPGSFFCEGGGYNMYCGEGHKLKVKDAWFGRFADDYHNCLPQNMTDNPNALPRLDKDCGGDAKGDLAGKFCNDTDNGCTLEIAGSKITVDSANPCPDRVPRYLYLEFECKSVLDGGAGALKPSMVGSVYVLVSALLMLIFRRTG